MQPPTPKLLLDKLLVIRSKANGPPPYATQLGRPIKQKVCLMSYSAEDHTNALNQAIDVLKLMMHDIDMNLVAGNSAELVAMMYDSCLDKCREILCNSQDVINAMTSLADILASALPAENINMPADADMSRRVAALMFQSSANTLMTRLSPALANAIATAQTCIRIIDDMLQAKPMPRAEPLVEPGPRVEPGPQAK